MEILNFIGWYDKIHVEKNRDPLEELVRNADIGFQSRQFFEWIIIMIIVRNIS